MKITLIALGMLVSTLSVQAQSQSIEKFFDKYMEYENVTDITLKGWVLKVASNFTDSKSGKRVLRKISKVRVLTVDERDLVSGRDIRQLINKVRAQQFEDLMEISDKENKVNFLIRETNNRITDVLLLAKSEDSFVMLSLEGLFNFEDLQDLELDIQGGEHFKKLPKDKSKVPQA